MRTLTHIVTPEEEGRTVRSLLKGRWQFSSHAISRLTRVENGIRVNGVHARTTAVLRAGDTVEVESGDHRPPKAAPVPGNWPLPVVWEDEDLLVVNKPAGMTAHASSFLPDTPTVAGALAFSRGTDFIFHPVSRLDKGTTGLMVIAKSGYVHDLLRRQLHTDAFRREYRGVCLGVPDPPQGTVDLPIGRAEGSAIARQIRPDGDSAMTHYETLETRNSLSLLRLVPETGRTHQLRLHMAALGCPLAGDWLYGKEDPTLIPRPALHSYALELVHPVTGEVLHLTAPLPEDMVRLGPWQRE